MCWCRFGGFLWDASLAHRRVFFADAVGFGFVPFDRTMYGHC
jgi:hypothetical protein